MNASVNVPWLLLDVKITRISNHPFNWVIIILCGQKRKHQWTLLWGAELVPEFWLGQHYYYVLTQIHNFCIIFLLCPGCSLDGKCNNKCRIPVLCRPNKSMPGVWSVILVIQVQAHFTCLSEKTKSIPHLLSHQKNQQGFLKLMRTKNLDKYCTVEKNAKKRLLSGVALA